MRTDADLTSCLDRDGGCRGAAAGRSQKHDLTPRCFSGVPWCRIAIPVRACAQPAPTENGSSVSDGVARVFALPSSVGLTVDNSASMGVTAIMPHQPFRENSRKVLTVIPLARPLVPRRTLRAG